MDGGEFENRDLVRDGAIGIDEGALGLNELVLKGFEALGVSGFDFEKTELAAVDGDDGVELEAPTGRIAVGARSLGELSHDNQTLGFCVNGKIDEQYNKENNKEPGGPHSRTPLGTEWKVDCTRGEAKG